MDMEVQQRSSAVEDRVEGKREGGEVVRRWKVETEWRCNGRLPGYCQSYWIAGRLLLVLRFRWQYAHGWGQDLSG